MATTVPSRVCALVALVILSFAVGAPGNPAQAAPPPPAADEAEVAEVAEGAPAAPSDAADASSDPSGDFAAAGAAVQNEGEASPDGDALDEVEAQGRASVDSRHSPGEQPELTVVPIHNAGGRAFDLAVGRHLMEGLVGVTHLTPLPATRAAIAKMHPAPKELHLPRTLTALGRRMKSSYVLVVEAIGAQHPTHVFVGLVEVKTGTTLLAYRAKMPRGVLSAELGLDLSARVRAALRHPAKLRRAAQARAEASSARPARPKVLPEPAALVPSEQSPAGEESVEDAGEAPDADDKAEKKKGKKRAKQIEEAKADEGGADEADLPRVLLDVARVWVRLPQMTQRISRLNVAAVDGASAPCYCGSPNSANPFFPMFGIGGEVFSGVLTKHRRRLQDGFGVRFDLGFAPVRSYVTGGSKATISSTVLQVEADALWRFVWLPRRTLSPDATLAVGMAYYGFPLKSAAYPGVAYIAPNFRLDLHFPVHKQVGLMAFGAVRPMMTPGGDARLRLGTPGKGTGLMLGLGVRGRWRIFDAEVRFRVESYGANFKGPTTLAGTPTGSSGTAVQFNNVRLRDALKEIVLQLGVSF